MKMSTPELQAIWDELCRKSQEREAELAIQFQAWLDYQQARAQAQVKK